MGCANIQIRYIAKEAPISKRGQRYIPTKRCQSVLLHHCAHQFTNLYWKWDFRFSIWDLDQNLVGNWNLVKVRSNHPMLLDCRYQRM